MRSFVSRSFVGRREGCQRAEGCREIKQPRFHDPNRHAITFRKKRRDRYQPDLSREPSSYTPMRTLAQNLLRRDAIAFVHRTPRSRNIVCRINCECIRRIGVVSIHHWFMVSPPVKISGDKTSSSDRPAACTATSRSEHRCKDRRHPSPPAACRRTRST
jgi:hypothetical protein